MRRGNLKLVERESDFFSLDYTDQYMNGLNKKDLLDLKSLIEEALGEERCQECIKTHSLYHAIKFDESEPLEDKCCEKCFFQAPGRLAKDCINKECLCHQKESGEKCCFKCKGKI